MFRKTQILGIWFLGTIGLLGLLALQYSQSCQANYTKLEQLLIDKKWAEADQETSELISKILRKAVDRKRFFGYSVLDTFQLNQYRSWLLYLEGLPCEDLKIIDQLWSRSSNGNFGLKAQAQIALSISKIVEVKGKPRRVVSLSDLEKRLGWTHLSAPHQPDAKLYFDVPAWYLPAQHPEKNRGFLPSDRWLVENNGKPHYSYDQALVHFIRCTQTGALK
ncbi:GUN4 domain-containing protein [Pantanalinema sp. GBBB05]|uniref:GUN4 domain-containing protein n=1 Tax=Pantanalinema sp. GBBB05 TaxID=2604139 RepID=UPI001D73D563|nr:hypothetical protein [Pantanalinema sp. GBBB05]